MEELSALGRQTDMPSEPRIDTLELVWAPQATEDYSVRFTCPEFTSLCPVTGQPDFATFVIDYVPLAALVESKSLKLYLASYRNHGGFHEACTADVFEHIRIAAMPRWLRVAAFWMPRGGIPIDVVLQSGTPPERVHVLPLDIPTYRGR